MKDLEDSSTVAEGLVSQAWLDVKVTRARTDEVEKEHGQLKLELRTIKAKVFNISFFIGKVKTVLEFVELRKEMADWTYFFMVDKVKEVTIDFDFNSIHKDYEELWEDEEVVKIMDKETNP